MQKGIKVRDEAVRLKAEGNKCTQAQEFAKARDFYQQSIKLKGEAATYSNLSLVQYKL